ERREPSMTKRSSKAKLHCLASARMRACKSGLSRRVNVLKRGAITVGNKYSNKKLKPTHNNQAHQPQLGPASVISHKIPANRGMPKIKLKSVVFSKSSANKRGVTRLNPKRVSILNLRHRLNGNDIRATMANTLPIKAKSKSRSLLIKRAKCTFNHCKPPSKVSAINKAALTRVSNKPNKTLARV